jgi:HPt (histidine-containing phosphotransfer) domain-containing protein
MAARAQEVERSPGIWRLPPFLAELSTQGHGDLVTDLLETFIEDTAMRLEAIEIGWARGDMRAAQDQAHTLKGSCQQMGADGMALACEQIGALAQANDTARGRALAALLAAQWAPVRQAMTACRDALRGGSAPASEQVVAAS